jgi:polyisoprenoid-binding protein YceI
MSSPAGRSEPAPDRGSAAAAQGAGVSVRAQTGDGWAVPDAILTVTDLSGRQVARAVASPEGVACTEPLPSGRYTAILSAAGYLPIARTATVGSTGSASLGTVTLARAGGLELPEPGIWTIDPAHTAINVTARHLGITSVRGRFTAFGGKIVVADPVERSTVQVTVQAESIDTGNKMRDDHLRSEDFLSVEKYPTIEFHSTGLRPRGGDKWTMYADLSLNGMTRPIELDLTYLGTGPDPWGGTRAAFHASTELHRDDFAMTYNQIVRAGIVLVSTTLQVELDVQAVQGDTLPVT